MLSNREIDLIAEKVARKIKVGSLKLLTLKEVAEILGYSYEYVRQNYRKLGIPYVMLPRGKQHRIRIRVKDLVRWLDSQLIDPSRIRRNLIAQKSKEQRRKKNASAMATRKRNF